MNGTANAAKLQPALLGGAVIGILSALPLVNVANCCCLWILAGGMVASYLMQQNHPYPITTFDGIIVGFLAGVVGAFVWLAVSYPINLVMAPFLQTMSQRILESARDVPPEFEEAIRRLGSGAAGLAIGFVLNLFLGMIFSTLGGLLGAVFFRKPTPPAVPPGQWTPPAGSPWVPPPPPSDTSGGGSVTA